MSLTAADLQNIRTIMHDAIRELVPPMIVAAMTPLKGEIAALRNDVKELYRLTTIHNRELRQSNRRVSVVEADVVVLKAHTGLSKA